MKTGASVGAHNIIEEDIFGESEPPSSSDLAKKKKATMSKLVIAMAFLNYSYDTDFKDSLEEHILDDGEGLNPKVKFVLASSPYNLRRNRHYDQGEYVLIGSKGVKDMTRDMKEKPKNLRHFRKP